MSATRFSVKEAHISISEFICVIRLVIRINWDSFPAPQNINWLIFILEIPFSHTRHESTFKIQLFRWTSPNTKVNKDFGTLRSQYERSALK
jgi:hypothetical protein